MQLAPSGIRRLSWRDLAQYPDLKAIVNSLDQKQVQLSCRQRDSFNFHASRLISCPVRQILEGIGYSSYASGLSGFCYREMGTKIHEINLRYLKSLNKYKDVQDQFGIKELSIETSGSAPDLWLQGTADLILKTANETLIYDIKSYGGKPRESPNQGWIAQMLAYMFMFKADAAIIVQSYRGFGTLSGSPMLIPWDKNAWQLLVDKIKAMQQSIEEDNWHERSVWEETYPCTGEDCDFWDMCSNSKSIEDAREKLSDMSKGVNH